MTNNIVRIVLILSIVFANIGCDQISKTYVRDNVEFHEYIDLMKGKVTLTKVENPGAFFGLGEDLPPVLKGVLLSLIPAIVITFILFFLLRQRDLPTVTSAGLSFIIGGGIGNIFDRIVYGSVTDFLHIDFGLFQTGIFNLADVSIMVGMGVVLVDRLMAKKDSPII